jgi:hypothetical protein
VLSGTISCCPARPGDGRRDKKAAREALKEAGDVKGSRRLVIVLAFLLVVAGASVVLATQAKAGTGAGFAMLKAFAESGGADGVVAASTGMGGPGMSCGAAGASCAGHEGGSSCSMGKSGAEGSDGATCSMGKSQAKSADGATCGMDKTGAGADAKAVTESCSAETCSAEKGGDCSTCDEAATCPMHQAKETTSAPDAK